MVTPPPEEQSQRQADVDVGHSGTLRALCDCCAQLLLLQPSQPLREALADFVEKSRDANLSTASLLAEYVDLQRRVLAESGAANSEADAASADRAPLPESLEGLPVYSTLAESLEAALLRLMAQEAVATVSARPLDDLRKSIERGLNWYELAALLDELTEWFARWRGTGLDRATGLPCGPALEKHLHIELERLQRFGQQFCVASLALEDADQLAEQYGAAAAEKALHLIARIARGALRGVDFIGRGEGAGLFLVLPGTSAGEALDLLADMADLVARSPFHNAGRRVEVRVSFAAGDADASDTVQNLLKIAGKR